MTLNCHEVLGFLKNLIANIIVQKFHKSVPATVRATFSIMFSAAPLRTLFSRWKGPHLPPGGSDNELRKHRSSKTAFFFNVASMVRGGRL